MLNLLITDSSLYCAQWDYQEDKPVLFSLVKVKFHSALSTIRSDSDGIQNTIRTAISQIDDFNIVQRRFVILFLFLFLYYFYSLTLKNHSEIDDILVKIFQRFHFKISLNLLIKDYYVMFKLF